MKNRFYNMNFIIKFKDLLVESLRDNKKLIIGLYILLIICFAVAWILSASKMQATLGNVPVSNNTGLDSSATELFIHNVSGGIMTYLASVFFAIPAIVMLIYNGMNLGVIGPLFNTIRPNGGIFYIVYLIPHGIFEITATVIQSACGIMLFLFVYRFIKALRSSETHSASDAFEKTKKILVQSLVLMIFSIILLLIAAPIEAYVSIPFAELIVGA